MSEPLRVGILGAARINGLSIIGPAQETGTRLVAVAARDRARAEEYAAAHGIERVLDSYADVVADPEVEAIYNPLPNAFHAPWNEAALRAGKHVLTEKPFASNAREAEEVRRLAGADRVVFEGFHYQCHPLFARMLDVISGGMLGELTDFSVAMEMPAPPTDDLRWSWDLAGGALMDMGCYCVHAIRMVAQRLGGAPAVTAADATERPGLPGIDERMAMSMILPGGVTAHGVASMNSPWNMSMTATGTAGTAHLPDFIRVHDDDRLILTTSSGDQTVEHLGSTSTYTYQLRAFIAAVRQGQAYQTTPEDSVRTMHLIDDLYQAAGLPVRPARSRIGAASGETQA